MAKTTGPTVIKKMQAAEAAAGIADTTGVATDAANAAVDAVSTAAIAAHATTLDTHTTNIATNVSAAAANLASINKINAYLTTLATKLNADTGVADSDYSTTPQA